MMKERKFILVFLGGLSLASAVAMFWLDRDESSQISDVDAFFARPTVADQRSLKEFSIKLNGVDWLTSTPVVHCGDEGNLDVVFPPRHHRKAVQALLICPRRVEDGPEAFEWIDLYCDWHTDVQSRPGDPEMRHPYIHPEPFRLKPGEYVVRIYLSVLVMDLELEEPPRNVLLAETRLRVLPDKNDPDCGLIPVSDPKKRMPAFIPN